MSFDSFIFLLNQAYPNSVKIKSIEQKLLMYPNEVRKIIDEVKQLKIPIIEKDKCIQLIYPLYSLKGIQSELSSKTVSDLILLPEIDSTNHYAKEHITTLNNRSMILAYRQTAGVGRIQRPWYSPLGKSLSMTILLKKLPVDLNMMPFSLLTAAALTKAIKPLTDKVLIKWPNDLILNNKKIAGILSKLEIDAEGNKQLIIGVGLNINQEQTDFPSEIQHKATSLRQELKEWIQPDLLIARFIEDFFYLTEQYVISKISAPFINYCKEHSAIIGDQVNVHSTSETTYPAKVIDIDNNGGLIIEHVSTGQVKTLLSNEISIRQPNGQYI